MLQIQLKKQILFHVGRENLPLLQKGPAPGSPSWAIPLIASESGWVTYTEERVSERWSDSQKVSQQLSDQPETGMPTEGSLSATRVKEPPYVTISVFTGAVLDLGQGEGQPSRTWASPSLPDCNSRTPHELHHDYSEAWQVLSRMRRENPRRTFSGPSGSKSQITGKFEHSGLAGVCVVICEKLQKKEDPI